MFKDIPGKCAVIVGVVRKLGKPLATPNSFDYFGVEVVLSNENSWHILLPFVLNVSVSGNEVHFFAGNRFVLSCLFDKLYLLADV